MIASPGTQGIIRKFGIFCKVLNWESALKNKSTQGCQELGPYLFQLAKPEQYQYSREYIPGNEKSLHNHPGILGPLVKHFPKIASAVSGSPELPASSSHLKGGKNPVHSVNYSLLRSITISLEGWTSTSNTCKNQLVKNTKVPVSLPSPRTLHYYPAFTSFVPWEP